MSASLEAILRRLEAVPTDRITGSWKTPSQPVPSWATAWIWIYRHST